MAILKMIEIDISSKTFLQDHDQLPLSVLRDIQFTVKSGEFCCIVGPSGCGKTTLLNLISGLDQIFEGSVAIDGDHHQQGRHRATCSSPHGTCRGSQFVKTSNW